jgi:hypothetical protein
LQITGTGILEGQKSVYMPAGVNFWYKDVSCDYNASRLLSTDYNNKRSFDLNIGTNRTSLNMECPNTLTTIDIDCYDHNELNPTIKVRRDSTFSSITQNGMWSPGFNPNSQESKKKNIELDDGCLQEILNTDICSYNWNFEDDDDQKHIGGIIADKGGNYKIAPKVLTHDKDGVDLYSMCGMSWKAIQELYDIIMLQDKKIKELEERLYGVEQTNKTK